MFRAAFPTASDESERIEANWVKANFDNSGGNRSSKARFAGTWVTAEVATNIANDYSLEKIIPPLTDAKPDPSTEYRKSSRAQQQQQQTPDKDPPPPKQLPTPSPSMSTPNPPKRRREASPAPSKSPSVAANSPIKTPLGPVTTRRSQRTTSPVPSPTAKLTSPKVTASTVKSPLKVLRSPVKTRRLEVVTPAGSDETAVDDDVPEVPGPDVTEDIQEQKEMIEAFKVQREEKLRAQATSEKDEGERKREREEENATMQFDFKEPEVQERKIATNRRIARLPEMTPERRSFAWGVAAFAAAVGAM